MTERHRPLTRDLLLGYFEEAFTPREDWRIGMELEKMGVDAATGVRIPYDGPGASVRSCLKRYLDLRGGNPVWEGENLVGLDGDWGTISLEPGGQVEWSSQPYGNLTQLDEQFGAHLAALDETARDLGIRWLDEAMDPDTAIKDVPWMPKARYKILRPYLGERGRLAHRMMTQTTSIQCAVDFSDPDDWCRKFRAASLLAPVAVALFANSPRADGAETGYRSFREAIWRETDPDRCRLPAVVFEPGFGIETWLDWVLDTPAIFLHRARGLVPAGGIPFVELMKRTDCRAIGLEDWELHLSSIFTEVRSYSYIEVRSADMLTDLTVMAVPTLYTGIFYDRDSLDGVVDLCAGHDGFEAWTEAMDSAARDGLEGAAGGRPLRELAERIVALAVAGLKRNPEFMGEGKRVMGGLESLVERIALDIGEVPGGRP
jgi:glutamate--cysteine ligase